MNVSEVTGNNSTSADQSPTAHQPTEGALDHPPFFEQHEALGLSGRSTTWTIQRQTSITHIRKGAPPKPPSTQIVVKRQSDLSMRLTRLRTRLPPSRSGTLAAVTNTRNN